MSDTLKLFQLDLLSSKMLISINEVGRRIHKFFSCSFVYLVWVKAFDNSGSAETIMHIYSYLCYNTCHEILPTYSV